MKPARNPDILAHHIELEAERRPDHRILTFESPAWGDRVVTYGDLWRNAQRLAGYWRERGLRKGDTIALMMRNYPEFVFAIVACSLSGVICASIDPRTKGRKLAVQLRTCGARLVLCDVDAARLLRESSLPDVTDILVHDPGGNASDDVRVGQVLAQDWQAVEQAVRELTEPHQIIYTSGTTGDPKGVVLDHGRAVAARNFIGLMGAGAEDVFYTGLSLTHANAQMMTAYPALWLGNHAVISETFTKRRLWDICRRFGCTTFTSLGGIMAGLYAEPERPDDADNPVRIVHSAGTPKAIWEAFERRFDVRIHEWYGTLEGGVATKRPGEGPVGSFGKPLPGAWTMKVVRPDGSECSPGEVGELIARPADGSPARVSYFGDPDASARKTRDGWLLSGDMVHRDADGWFFFDYRSGGGIRRNGDFVQPDHVERVLLEHPDIDDAFVYGVTATGGAPGEKDVVAAVVAAPDRTIDVLSVFQACRRSLEPNFVPSFLQIVDAIPKTISEKPQERFLVEMFEAGQGVIVREPPA